jgi:two-component system sensor histidine kinase RegB
VVSVLLFRLRQFAADLKDLARLIAPLSGRAARNLMDARVAGHLRETEPLARASAVVAAHGASDGDLPRSRIGPVPPPLLASIRQLMLLRTVAVSAQTAAIATSWALGVSLPLAAMASVVAILVVLNVLTWIRLRSSRRASHAEIAAHLGTDLAALTALLFLSGGAANPFSLLFVLHVVLIALLLPPLAAASGTAVVVACYVLLVRFHTPLAMTTGEPLAADLIGFGWGVSFALTAGISAWFVIRIVATLREHDRWLNEATQQALRDDAVLRVGALAAGAAHELATPLTTMAVIAGDIARSANSPSLQQDAGILTSQIKICRETIANLMAAAGHARAVGGGRERLDRFLESIATQCRTMRPEANIVCDWSAILPVPEILGEQALKQALLALLNNAVDASPEDVQFAGRCDANILRLSIADRGRGLPAGNLGKLGRTFFTTKPPGKGAGIGLVVAARAIERLRGTLRWENRVDGGMRVEVLLPLDSLRVTAEA